MNKLLILKSFFEIHYEQTLNIEIILWNPLWTNSQYWNHSLKSIMNKLLISKSFLEIHYKQTLNIEISDHNNIYLNSICQCLCEEKRDIQDVSYQILLYHLYKSRHINQTIPVQKSMCNSCISQSFDVSNGHLWSVSHIK